MSKTQTERKSGYTSGLCPSHPARPRHPLCPTGPGGPRMKKQHVQLGGSCTNVRPHHLSASLERGG